MKRIFFTLVILATTVVYAVQVDMSGWIMIPNPGNSLAGSLSANNITADASGEGQAFSTIAPDSICIQDIDFYISAVTSAGDAAVGVQTLDSNGDPTGTYWVDGASDTVSISATGWYTGTLEVGATVQASQRYMITITNSSGNYQIPYNTTGGSTSHGHSFFNVGSWIKTGGPPAHFLKDCEGSYIKLLESFYSPVYTLTTYNSTDTPDHYGNVFTLNAPVTLRGVWLHMSPNASTTLTVQIIDSDEMSSLFAIDISTESTPSNTNLGFHIYPTTATATLNAGSTYRVVLQNEDLSNQGLYYMSVADSSAIEALPYGSDVQATSAKDPFTGGGSWTDDATQRYFIGLVVSGIDDGISAGGGGETSHTFVN